jgi:hypothetical protein
VDLLRRIFGKRRKDNMQIDYRLPESVIQVMGSIERVRDSKVLEADVPDYEEATAEILLVSRGDEGDGQQVLDLKARGDEDFAIELTADQRLTSISYKSIGVGGKVVAAGTTLLATMAGVAARAVGGGRKVTGLADGEPTRAELEEHARAEVEKDARAGWDAAHLEQHAHQEAYKELRQDASSQIDVARRKIVDCDDPTVVAAAASRAYRLEAVVAAANVEIAKVETLYRAWRDSFKTSHTERLSWAYPVDALPVHDDTAATPNVAELTGRAEQLWDQLGVLVEIGPADGYHSSRPSVTIGAAPAADRVVYRVPRPVRFWVWRRGKGDLPTLERSFEAHVVDRFSPTRSMEIDGVLFGESGGTLHFDALGAVTAVGRNTKSGVGAVADAIAAVPGTVAGALDNVTKASTSLGSLADAGAERRLQALKREHDTLTKKLDKEGLAATSEDFARLKRLEQQVAIAKAEEGLAPTPVTELSQAQSALGLATAQRDLEAVVRERALDGELAGAQAEIARLTAQLRLAELKAKK